MVLLAVAAVTFGSVGLASAHPTLLFTEPGSEAGVADSPQSITLMFNETVTVGPGAVVLLDNAGREVPVGAASTGRDGQFVSARLAETLPAGTYTVRWRVTGSDGDLVEDDFRFAVGLALTGGGEGNGGQSTSWLDVALRWLLFTGLAVALGGLIGERFTSTARAEKPTLPAPRSPVAGGVLIALVGVVGLGVTLVVGAGTGSALWQGGAGGVLLAEAAGLMLALALIVVDRRRWAIAAVMVVVAAEGVRSHADVAAPGWGAVLTGVHLAAAAIWVGALLQTARAVVVWRHERAAVQWVLAGYTRLAGWTFVVVVVTGVVSGLLLVPLSALVSTTYGRVLLVKLGLVAGASGLALAARRMHRAPDRFARVRKVIRGESAMLILVLAASAVLVSTPPVSGSQQSGPPVPIGPLLPLGTLAGQVGVSVAASEGQVVVRLSTPRRGDYYAPEPDQEYALTGRLATSGIGGGTLDFGGCGQGCFVAPARWGDGDNVLTLRVDAPGWEGGTVSELVPWPTKPGGDDLARAVELLRAAGDITVYEAVTSDTSVGTSDPQRLDLSAAFFLEQEPYAAGTAPVAVRISQGDGPVRLALGYPAASMNVLLTLDDQGRISEETLTDTKHLVTRRFVYSDHR
ncbi:copper resistance protein CopC [Rhodococcus opacus]|nr:copper resistance protein CopC [Rhodococcus opacus]